MGYPRFLAFVPDLDTVEVMTEHDGVDKNLKPEGYRLCGRDVEAGGGLGFTGRGLQFAALFQEAFDAAREQMGLEPHELSPEARRVLLLEYSVERSERIKAFNMFIRGQVVPCARSALKQWAN